MPKMKSVRGAAKRFKKTKNKLKRGSAFHSHILTKQDSSTNRDQRKSKYISKSDLKSAEKMLCMA